MNKLQKTLAFTLSEVLMVLGIIGVVAAVTLPNLNDNADEQVNVAKAKKVYGELATAWDRAMLKDPITNASNLTAANVMNKMTSYMNIKQTGEIYSPLNDNNDCKATAILLSDGSTICVIKSTDTVFNVLFDLDGPDKGENLIGSDKFYSSITFRTGELNPPTLEPFYQTSTLSSTDNKIVSGNSVSNNDYLLWIMTYNNMDYKNCSATVKWVTQTTCN